jgi:hypothetical protein
MELSWLTFLGSWRVHCTLLETRILLRRRLATPFLREDLLLSLPIKLDLQYFSTRLRLKADRSMHALSFIRLLFFEVTLESGDTALQLSMAPVWMVVSSSDKLSASLPVKELFSVIAE